MFLNEPIEKWPEVDVLISFYSKGFPMEKALKYVNFNKKLIQINDLESQKILWDRRKIYTILKNNGIPIAKHYFVNRKIEPAIDQEYLELYAKEMKGREEYLIQYAKEMRSKYSKSNQGHVSPSDAKNGDKKFEEEF